MILIVEDNPTNALIAVTICQRAGYQTTVAGDGLEALMCLEERPYALIVTDVQMPRLDGLAMVRQVRADARWAGLPIIAVTARANPAEHGAMLEAGIDLIITKPYHNRELREAVVKALSRTPR
jgi:CheY-like chemotaxis protein